MHLLNLKGELFVRWPMTSLLDVLKETDLRVGIAPHFASLTSHEALEPDTLQRRLLLCLYGLGTNTGLKRVANGNDGESAADLRYVLRRYVQKEGLRQAIGDVVNATFRIRRPDIWREGTTACASDSYNRFQHAAHLVVAADLAGFSHRGLALLAATIQLAEKEQDALRRFEPLVSSVDHPMLNRAAAVLLVADVLERLIGDTSLLRCVRKGRALTLVLSVAAPWPLLEPLRRLGQAYGLDVHLARDLDARAA